MKKALFIFTAASLTGLRGAIADDRPVNIRMEMQVVAIPEAQALPLVADLLDKKKIDAAYATIQEMLGKGSAKLVAWPILNTKSGERAVAENIDEVRYPTEFDPPTISFLPGVDPGSAVMIEPRKEGSHLQSVPTAFETRNVGVTIEAEPVLEPDGKTIDVNVAAQDVRLKKMITARIDMPTTSSSVTVDQPEFTNQKVTTSLTMKSGQRIMLGMFRTDELPNHIEFFIFKVEAIPLQ
jgi:Flp pilus assembly secretin CpaC